MRYTEAERLDIGRRIYEGEMDRYEAAKVYGISDYTARNYMRLYRKTNGLPEKQHHHGYSMASLPVPAGYEDLQNLTKEQLIRELVKARIAEARLKKGYEVKGDGTVILYDIENTK